MENNKQEYAIGYDLGTTFSVCSVFRNGQVEIIANELGNRTMPSYVSFTEEERLIGEPAKNNCANNPTNTVFDAKRLIGRKIRDPVVQSDMKHWPFTVVEGLNENPLIEVVFQNEKKQFTPEQISSMVLSKMRATAEKYLGQEARNAVITVPAYFNDSQRQATKDAGEIAGLNVLRIINEPTSAAIAYGLDKIGDSNSEVKVVIFDCGGGTTDLSLLSIKGGIFKVLSTYGDSHLGGEDLDNKLVEYCVTDIYKKYSVDISQDLRAIRRLRTKCEQAKCALSSMITFTIEVDCLFTKNNIGTNYTTVITRAKFEFMCQDFFKKCIDPLTDVLKTAKVTKDEIKSVVLVGGSSRIPKLQEMLVEYFGGNKKILCHSVNPDEVVSAGASIQASILMGNQDEKTKELLLVDVTPLSLGVAIADGLMSRIIEKNTTIPTKATKTFSTFQDNQPSVLVRVFEGERVEHKNNNKLGSFELTDIPPLPRGVPRIDVTFEVDANGILTVSAVEVSTGKKKTTTINSNKGRLSRSEITKMLSEAEQFKKQDEEVKKKADAKNELENYVYAVRTTIPSLENKVSADDYKKVNEAIVKLIQWLDQPTSRSANEYTDKFKEVESICRPILTIFHQNRTAEEAKKAEEKKEEKPKKKKEDVATDDTKVFV